MSRFIILQVRMNMDMTTKTRSRISATFYVVPEVTLNVIVVMVINLNTLTTEIQSMWNVKTNVNRDNWNNLKIIQKITELHTGKT